MNDHPFCPSCGHNFRADVPITRGPWYITPDEVRWHGVRTALAGNECVIMHTLALAAPRTVTLEVLANRCTTVGSVGSLRVRFTRIKSKLGGALPIENVNGIGYRWVDE